MQKNIQFETTAKTKICPLIFLNEASNGGVTIEEQTIYKNAFCITSQCMAWRYVEAQHFHGRVAYGDTDDKTDRGYCTKL